MKYLKRHAWLLFTVLIIGGLIAATLFSGSSNEENNVGVVVKEHIKGNPDAAVVLTEYSDLQCPACAQAAPFVAQIVEEYGDQIRFEYKHFPLISIHPLAVSAAQAAEAAGQQDKFFEYHDLLFENQRAWSASGNPTGFYLTYAEELGLDMEMFKRHMKSSVLKDRVLEQYGEAEALQLTSTPSFLLNGERMQFSSYADIRDQIEAAINGGSVPVEVDASPEAIAEPIFEVPTEEEKPQVN